MHLPKQGSIWVNKKRFTKYVAVGANINATNGNEGQQMVEYICLKTGWKYSREYNEFMEKFREFK